jgi:hypothetical protein
MTLDSWVGEKHRMGMGVWAVPVKARYPQNKVISGKGNESVTSGCKRRCFEY